MKSMKIKLVVLSLLIAGLLSACGGQAAQTPVSQPTDTLQPATEVPATLPPAATDTSAPATEHSAATESVPSGATVSFANDALPLIQSRCVNCHGGDRTEEGLNLTSHAAILAGSEHGAVIVPGDAANSLLVELAASQEMPKRGPKLTPPQVQSLTEWVNQGAPEN